MLYVNMCDTAMDLFSRNYFKEYFFMPLVGLSGNAVWKSGKKCKKGQRLTAVAKCKITPPSPLSISLSVTHTHTQY
jgi:hypothetical protein